MNSFIILAFLISIPLISVAGPKYDPNPTIAIFAKDLMGESYKSCWDDKKQFKANECQTYSEACVIDRHFQNEIKVDAEIPPLKGESQYLISRNDGGRTNKYFTTYGQSNNQPFKITKLSAGTRVLAFKKDSNKITIFADEVITTPKVINPIEKKPIKTFRFKAEEGWLVSHMQKIDGLFMGHEIGSISGPVEPSIDPKAVQEIPEIQIPEGKYNITFSYYNIDSGYFINSFEISASAEDTKVETIIIKKKDFIKESSRGFSLKENSYEFYDSFREGENLGLEKGFSEKPEIQLVEKNLSLNSYFDMEQGNLIPKDELKKILSDSTKDIPTYTVRISGKCSTFFHYKEYNSFDVRSKPDEKSTLLGMLKVVNDQDQENVKFVSSDSSQITKFRPNLHNGSCGDTSHHFLHYVKESNGDWVNLGSGPWGPVGWSTVDNQPLYGGNIVEFQWESNQWVTFSRKDKKIFATGTKIFASPEGDVENEKINFEVFEQDFFDENGNLKIKVNCRYGC